MATPVELEDQKLGFFGRVKNLSITVAALIIAIGSWNDSVDFISQLYDVVKSQFTHQVEYEKLAKIQVGISKEFVQEQFGAPQLIRGAKGATVNEKVVFAYYLHKKYALLLAYQDEQVNAFLIVGLVDNFKPENIINLEIVTKSDKINEAATEISSVSVSLTSSAYLTEQELNKENLFLKRYIGFAHNPNLTNFESKLANLEKAIVFQSETTIESSISELNQLPMNAFGLGNLSVELVTSALLSGQEMKIYTQGIK